MLTTIRPTATASAPSNGLRLLLLFIAALLLTVVTAGAQPPAVELELERVASGLLQPIAMANAGDGTNRLFIVEQAGTIRILDGNQLRNTPFLDIRNRVRSGGERGLLGLAFDPDYAANGRFYVHYSRANGDSVIARFNVSAGDPDVAQTNSETRILVVGQPFSNHNGGQLAFGPDGFLYIALGDGGSGGDPLNSGQDTDTLLGALLRIDVSTAPPYTVPPGNPFSAGGGRPEIWAYGLRNPWRFSFDRDTGDLFIADVGQNSFEELSFEPAGSPGGVNYGWNRMEGRSCFSPSTNCNDGSLTEPVLDYGRNLGGSITGGYRYRGRRFPALDGIYLFGDFVSGRIFGAVPRNNTRWDFSTLRRTGFNISTFGEDEDGEIYVADYGGGAIHLLMAAGAGGACPWPVGHPHFCRDCGLCGNGEGDCDGDDECRGSLVCVEGVGRDFGFRRRTAVCLPPAGSCPVPLGRNRFCTDCGPCGVGEGDCDNDDECRAGLTCTEDVGPDFGFGTKVDVCL